MADLSTQQWAAAVLRALNVHQTPGAIQALTGWARAEGGHWNNDARYNPLNTTQPMPGAGNTGTQGNIKVYKNWQQGIDATVKTLRNGRYNGIIAGLKSGSPQQVASAIGKTPWGTSGGLVQRTIMNTPRAAGVHAPKVGGGRSGSSSGHRSGGSPGTPDHTITTTTPGVDNSSARAALVQSFLEDRNADPLYFATQSRDLRDVAPTSTSETIPGTPATRGHSSGGGGKGGGGGKFAAGHSKLLELIHSGGSGYAVKDGKVVDPSVYSAVWAGHRDHVHVAAGPKTIVELGKLAEKMGLHAGENPHFGGVAPVHVPGSYHYKGEAIDVSGNPRKMAEYAARVERIYGLGGH